MEKQVEMLEHVKPAVVRRQPNPGWDEKKREAWKQTCGAVDFGMDFDVVEACKRVRYGE